MEDCLFLKEANLTISIFKFSITEYLTTSASNTLSTAIVSSPLTSCSTCNTDTCDGIYNSLRDIARSNVVFPIPFLPTNPYLRPKAIIRFEFCNNTLNLMEQND